MKKVLFVLSFVLVLFSCKKEENKKTVPKDLEMYFVINQENDEKSFLLEKEIEHKINLIENDSLKQKVVEFDSLTKNHTNYLDSLINKLFDYTLDINNPEKPINNAAFSESKFVDELFFKDNKHSLEGREFLKRTDFYKKQIVKLSSKNSLKEKINYTLNTNNPLNREGKKTDWLEYHFKDFPMIAVLTKFKMYKKDILQLENEFIDDLLIKKD